MKKLLFVGIAAAAMLTSCSNDETIEMPKGKAIAFTSFVNKSVKGIIGHSATIDSLKNNGFAVYGYASKGSDTTRIFNGTTVTYNQTKNAWEYSPLQYWATNLSYKFGAIAPANTNVTGLSWSDYGVTMAVSFTNDGKTDLLYASAQATTSNDLSSVNKVSFTFKHQLSKVKFSFANAVGEGYSIKVRNVKITNAKKSAFLNVAVTNLWSAHTDTLELDFGNVVGAYNNAANAADTLIVNGAMLETCKELFMIPTDSNVSYAVTFTVELLQNGLTVGTYNHSVTISGVALQLGYCYDFLATLTKDNVNPDGALKPIEFTVASVNDWNQVDQTVTFPSQAATD